MALCPPAFRGLAGAGHCATVAGLQYSHAAFHKVQAVHIRLSDICKRLERSLVKVYTTRIRESGVWGHLDGPTTGIGDTVSYVLFCLWRM